MRAILASSTFGNTTVDFLLEYCYYVFTPGL